MNEASLQQLLHHFLLCILQNPRFCASSGSVKAEAVLIRANARQYCFVCCLEYSNFPFTAFLSKDEIGILISSIDEYSLLTGELIMKRMKRLLSAFLALCMICSAIPFSASADGSAEYLTYNFMTATAAAAKEQIDGAISTGTLSDGVRTDISFPEVIVLDNFAMTPAQYAYLAAQTITMLSAETTASTSLKNAAIICESDSASGSAITSVTGAEYLLLAGHVKTYAQTENALPSSFCLSNGNRICIYSICSIFASVLSQYSSNNVLPSSVSFTPTSYTTAQTTAVSDSYPKVLSAAVELIASVESKGRLPDAVQYGNTSISCTALLKLMCTAIISISNGTASGTLTVSTPNSAPNPSETATAGSLTKTNYLTYCQNTLNFINNNNYCPNYTTTALGTVRYENFCYMAARILRYYGNHNALPSSVSISPWSEVVAAASRSDDSTAAGDAVTGVWLWPSTVYNCGTNGAAELMARYADVGITDVYLLVKGTAGSCAWNTSVSGATKTYTNRDILGECCTAAAPYGIRIHCWMMTARDDNYLASHSTAAYYHFRYGTGTEVTRYVNLRNSGYISYCKKLISEIVANYSVAGFHFDTLRYGALYYDWGAEARNLLLNTYGLTKEQYNAGIKALCMYANTVSGASYKYSANSDGYYIFNSNGTAPSGTTLTNALSLNDGSAVAAAAQAAWQMRTDTVKNYVSAMSSVCADAIITCATMPECATSKASEMVYGQCAAKLATVTDYICPMTYDLDYGHSASWVKTVVKAIASDGGNVVAAIQTYDNDDGTEATGSTIYDAMYYTRLAASETAASSSITGKVLGSAFFRGYYTALSGTVYDEENKTAKLCFYAPCNQDITKIQIVLQNGMTVDKNRLNNGFADKNGWGSSSFTVSDDGKTITIYKNGSDILTANGSAAGFTVALSGTYSDIYGVAKVMTWDGTNAGISANVTRKTVKEEPLQPVCTGTHIEFWEKENGTHFAFCYDCATGTTQSCAMELTSSVKPDCITEGKKVYSCVGGINPDTGNTELNAYSVTGGCGYTHTDTVLPGGHTVSTASDNGDGTHIGLCSVCSTYVAESHPYDNGVCPICGAYLNGLHYAPQTDLTSAEKYIIAYLDKGSYYALTTQTSAVNGTNVIAASRLYLDENGNAIVCDDSNYAVFTPAEQTNTYSGVEGLTLRAANSNYLVLPNSGIGYSNYYTNGFFAVTDGGDGSVSLKLDGTADTKYISYRTEGYFNWESTAKPLYLFGVENAQILYKDNAISELSVPKGETGTFAYALHTDRIAAALTWVSDQTSVLEVDSETGSFYAKMPGTATVTLTLYTYDASYTDYREITKSVSVTVEEVPHLHDVSCDCGESSPVLFTKLSSGMETLTDGAYYLESDLVLTNNLTISGEVSLCLNGHRLTAGNHILIVSNGATLKLCDCGVDGKIQATTYGIALNGGTLHQYGGTIRAEGSGICYGAELENGANLYLDGGTISASGSGTNAYGIRNYSTGTVQIEGGSVLCSGTNANYYGIYNYSSGSVNVSGGTITGPYALVNNGVMQLSGGAVTAAYYGAVLVGGSFTLTDGPLINGMRADFYLGNGQKLLLPQAISPMIPYTVELRTMPDAGGFAAFTDGFVSAMPDTEPSSCFAPINNTYVVVQNDTEAALHSHAYTSSETQAATCTAPGVTSCLCSCGSSYTEPIAVLGHDYTLSVTEPTCTAAGYTTHTCTRCADTYTDKTSEALGHDFTDTVVLSPTCTEAGIMLQSCARCGYETASSVAPAGHTFADGVCTSCGIADASAETELQITSAALCLNENINIVYTAAVPADCTQVYMTFVFNGQSTRINDDGSHRFVFEKLTPQCMGDNISAVLHATCGNREYTDSLEEYSVRQYCVNMLNRYPENTVLSTLLSDLLAYGAAAQTYTDYKTEALVTEDLSLSPSNYSEISGYQFSLSGEREASADWRNATLILSNCLTARFTFAAETVENLTVRISINGRTERFDKNDFVSVGEGKYYVDFREIKAAEFGSDICAAFYNGDTPCGRQISYCVNAYICSMQNNESVPNLAALVRALYCYGRSAEAYTAQ